MMKYLPALSRAVLVGCLCLASPIARAAQPVDCEIHARAAEQAHGIPPGLIIAIARTESGRTQRGKTFAAWPWTLNVQGKGHYFKSRAATLAHLTETLNSGVRSVDIGCMQINYRWHSQEFPNVEAMLDPVTNTDYAARYLKSLYDRTGSWETATAHYHSRDPDRGAAYQSRVAGHHKKLDDLPKATVAVNLSAPAGPLSVSARIPAPRMVPADSRFQSRPALVGLPEQPQILSNLNLPQGQRPKSLSEVRSAMN